MRHWQTIGLRACALRRCLPVGEHVTCLLHAAWIDSYITFVDVANDAFLIDDKGRAISKTLLFVEDSIIFHHGAFEIAE